MATARTTKSSTAPKQPRQTVTDLRKEVEDLKNELENARSLAYCYMCDTHKKKADFYKSTDPRVKSGITPICKACARKIALRTTKSGIEHPPTKESVIKALSYLNKPFITSLWVASIQEAENKEARKQKNNPWTAYVKNVALDTYVGMTFEDSDIFEKELNGFDESKSMSEIIEEHSGQDTYDSFHKNQSDVIRLLDYDPFENEDPHDQPQLYAQLLGLIDQNEDSNSDLMRNASCIIIVRGLLQISKIDDAIAKALSDPTSIYRDSTKIKALEDSKQKISSSISTLCKDNCISLQYTKNSKKGENTWTGKIKRIKDLNLRQGEVNGFDMETCKAMSQVMDLSNASIMKQLHLDESEWSDIVAEQRSLITKLQTDLDRYIEISRILLRENLDIKDCLNDEGISLKLNTVNLDDLFSCFAEETINDHPEFSDVPDIDEDDIDGDTDG